MEKLEDFWKHADVGIKFKIIVYDAVVRAKLMYGLESMQFNKQYVNALKCKRTNVAILLGSVTKFILQSI